MVQILAIIEEINKNMRKDLQRVTKKKEKIENEVNYREDNTINSSDVRPKNKTSEGFHSSRNSKMSWIIDFILIIPKVYILEYFGLGEYVVPFVVISIIIDFYFIIK